MTANLKWRKDGARVAVLGATGAVGREIIRCIEALALPVSHLDLLASPKSVGKIIDSHLGKIPVVNADTFDFSHTDIVLSSAGKNVSLNLAPKIVNAGALMIDNTSAFRRSPQYKLIVPEVNGSEILPQSGIIANPNCSTIQLVLPLKALDDAVGIHSVRVTTFQSCSGAGQKGIDALMDETQQALNGHRPEQSKVHARTIAFDVVPQIGAFDEDDGFTEEEHKMMFETRKILNKPDLKISATCVRVPVVRSHSEAVNIVTDKPISPQMAAELCSRMPGLRVTDIDNPLNYPTAFQAQNLFDTLIGRIRRDPVDSNGLIFWIVSDNLLKGAALNAVQIACAAWDHARMV